MKRIIKNIAALDDDLRRLLQSEFPDGIRKHDLVSFPVPGGKRLHGVEIVTNEAIYLVRIPNALALLETGRGPQLDYLLMQTEVWEE